VLGAATDKKPTAFLTHLDTATHVAGRLATRVAAFNTAAEILRMRADFAALAPTVDSVLRSLASAARSAALTLITHRSEQFVALEVRLRRCAHLIHVLAEQLGKLSAADPDVLQVRQMLAQVEELLPVIQSTLVETVDHGTARGGFTLRLPELGELNARSLGSWLNRAPQLDPLLVRYSLRVAVVSMLAVAVYKWFDVPRGYWIAFTAIVVLQPDYGATRQKAGQRIVGTLAGSALGTVLLWIKMPLPCLLALTGVMAFCFAYFVKRRYGLAVFFVTLMIVLITEAVMPVHWDFTVSRLLSNLAGGALALGAALLFWPNWEQEQFPKIMAAAVRANRNYLEAIGARLISREPFAGDVIQTKRVAERANSLVTASVQRQLGEPSAQQHHVERAAALMAYNQRVTRALAVLAVHLNKREPRDASEISGRVARTGEALEHLALAIERDPNAPAEFERNAARSALAACLQVDEPRGGQSAGDLVHNQFGKVATEIAAMMLALNMTEEKS
jgi:uncharacterized membrane protein YccC